MDGQGKAFLPEIQWDHTGHAIICHLDVSASHRFVDFISGRETYSKCSLLSDQKVTISFANNSGGS
jgi:hypothetical protein